MNPAIDFAKIERVLRAELSPSVLNEAEESIWRMVMCDLLDEPGPHEEAFFAELRAAKGAVGLEPEYPDRQTVDAQIDPDSETFRKAFVNEFVSTQPSPHRVPGLVLYYRGRVHTPDFQFDTNGDVRSSFRAVLDAMPCMSSWQAAFWFVSSNEALEGQRPVDLLDINQERVLKVARHSGESFHRGQ